MVKVSYKWINGYVYLRIATAEGHIMVSSKVALPTRACLHKQTVIATDGVDESNAEVFNARLKMYRDHILNEMPVILASDWCLGSIKEHVKGLVVNGLRPKHSSLKELCGTYIKGVEDLSIMTDYRNRAGHVRVVGYVQQALKAMGKDLVMPRDNPHSSDPMIQNKVKTLLKEIGERVGKSMSADKLADNTRKNYRQHLSKFLDWVETKTYIRYHIPIKVKVAQTGIRVMDTDVALLMLKEYDSMRMSIVTKKNRAAFDYAVLALLTALRVDDLLNVKKGDFRVREGEWWLRVVPRKTQSPIEIPLQQDIIRSMMEYNDFDDRDNSDPFIERLSTSQFTARLKRTMKDMPGMDFDYVHETSVDGKTVAVKEGKACDLITPHYLRRTSATLRIMHGVDPNVVRLLGGWSERSDSFNRYISYGNSYIAKENNKFLAK